MAVLLEADLWRLMWQSQFVVNHNNWVMSNFNIIFIQSWCLWTSCVLARGESSLSSPQTDRVGMKHRGKGFSPHWMRNRSLSMALPSHMQTCKHTHILVPLLIIPAGTLGKSPPSHPHLSAPTPPPSPPVAADVPRSVAYHLLPPSPTHSIPPTPAHPSSPNLHRLSAPSYPYDNSLVRFWAPPNRTILRFTCTHQFQAQV